MSHPKGSIQAVFFDFGGCLDSPGIHTRTLFLRAFLAENLLLGRTVPDFQEAYTKADQEIIENSLVLSLGLVRMNQSFAEGIAKNLGIESSGDLLLKAANHVTDIQKKSLQKNLPTLRKLSISYSLGVISNFSGNLELILSEEGLAPYFRWILDSYHVGFCKPDPRLFEEALHRSGLRPESCLFIGDNPERDIAPAKQLGMKTALIHEPGKKIQCSADFYITEVLDLEKLPEIGL